MPISSTHSRLTRDSYRPPPKSLEQLQMEGNFGAGSFGSKSSLKMFTPTGSPITREKHLNHLPYKKTAVVVPVSDTGKGMTNGAFEDVSGGYDAFKKNGAMSYGGKGAVGETAGALGGAATTGQSGGAFTGAAATGAAASKGAFFCCWHAFLCCMPWWLIPFLLGLLLGALIAGLTVGLILGGQLDEAVAGLVVTNSPNDLDGCFQSPCSAGDAVCQYRDNNTEIDCQCLPLVGDPVSTAGISAEAYRCNFYSPNSTTGEPIPVT